MLSILADRGAELATKKSPGDCLGYICSLFRSVRSAMRVNRSTRDLTRRYPSPTDTDTGTDTNEDNPDSLMRQSGVVDVVSQTPGAWSALK
jgi:hypothetical protein